MCVTSGAQRGKGAVKNVKVVSYNVLLVAEGQSVCKTASTSLLVQEDGGGQM